ncbi:MAG: ATPase [Acetobacterium sp. MES1]|uniref:AAA family ATPase n=1 Tax=Acetobacterium sp. MES1 TaxID=1899015 RepID=UPI000B9CBA71|nr:ATP-binding protein [Acetobacterium sp. MES1]OXS25335.1 MAG: ATPase [Acetobacterium sp. MES1]
MKANLIENLIVSHCTGDESKFSDAVYELIKDEEKKGNVPLAARLRKTYETKLKNKTEPEFNVSSSSFTPQSAKGTAPRDKDSLLELYEIIQSTERLEDVILPESQKNALVQLIEEQKNADDLKKHNIEPANRLLLCGPPGCGKTMTAYAIGQALELPIAYVRLDGLVSSYLGQTSTNLRKVFDSVRNQRIILFLDEFDAIAKKRDDSNELGELKRVVTTLLQNFDNMPSNVLLIAATNHEHLLDPAIWRRFNLTITMELPNEAQRLILLQKWMKEYAIIESLDYENLAKITEGLNGAQIKELTKSAAKKYYISKAIKTEDVIAIFIQQQTMYSGSNDDVMKLLSDMNNKGVSLRSLAKAIGVTHSTLDYRIKKYRGEQVDE